MFDFSNFEEVGDYLVKIDGEAFKRSAISRYYYSLFDPVRLYLIFVLDEYEFRYGKDFHKRICKRLIDSQDDTEAELGLILDELRQLISDADYNRDLGNDYFNEKLSDVKSSLKLGFEQLNALKVSPPYRL